MQQFSNEKLAEDLQKSLSNYTELAEKYSVSRPTIRAYAKRLGLYRGDKYRLRRHTVDKDYFKSIDTINKAYTLGFIYADGCNTRKGLQIGIQENDKEVLQFIKKELQASNTLRYILPFKDTWSPKWELNVQSMILSEDLTNVGCPPAKFLILTFPTFINKSLMPHFIRGYFDGDGSIHFSNGSCRIAFTSASKSFIKDLDAFLKNEVEVTLQTYTNKKNACGSLQTSKQESIKKLLTYLYNDASFSMKRKREKALAFLAGRGGM